jgi:hypothetical protein
MMEADSHVPQDILAQLQQEAASLSAPLEHLAPPAQQPALYVPQENIVLQAHPLALHAQ